MSRAYWLDRFRFDLPDSWQDTTTTANSLRGPLTFEKRSGGVGHLQLSVASYQGKTKVLDTDGGGTKGILEGYAKRMGVSPDPVVTVDGNLKGIYGEFRKDGGFFGMWVLTDGKNYALATYGSTKADVISHELAEATLIVSSMRWVETPLGKLAKMVGLN